MRSKNSYSTIRDKLLLQRPWVGTTFKKFLFNASNRDEIDHIWVNLANNHWYEPNHLLDVITKFTHANCRNGVNFSIKRGRLEKFNE